MSAATPPGSRRQSNADAQPLDDQKQPPQQSQETKKSTWAKTRQWTRDHKVETGLIIANVLIGLGVLTMGAVGSTTGHGISFQDMVSGDAWKISAIALGSLVGADLLIAGGNELYKRYQAKKQAQKNEDGAQNAHADDARLPLSEAEADAAPEATEPPAAAAAVASGNNRMSTLEELLKPQTAIHTPSQQPQPQPASAAAAAGHAKKDD